MKSSSAGDQTVKINTIKTMLGMVLAQYLLVRNVQVSQNLKNGDVSYFFNPPIVLHIRES